MSNMESPDGSNWKSFIRAKPRVGKRAKTMEKAALKHAHRYLVKRFDNAREVKRHVVVWTLLVIGLLVLSAMQSIGYDRTYSTSIPSEDGAYAEGVIGDMDTINPLYATSQAELSASELVFAGLLSYDNKRALTGELAKSWTVSEDGKTYDVSLRENVLWHDGAPFTAEDVVFTVDLLKNPAVRSPYRNSWIGITATAVNDQTVRFEIPNEYAPFANALTFGVLPKHALDNVNPAQLRETGFNRAPIGLGPFSFRNIQIIDPDQSRLVLSLNRNNEYVLGAPKIARFQLHTYADSEALRNGIEGGEVNAAVGMSTGDTIAIESTQVRAFQKPKATVDNGVYALFNNDSAVVKDVDVRRAIRLAIDRPAIISELNGYGAPLEGPLLPEQVTDEAGAQPDYSLEKAKQLLDEAGWKTGDDGIRAKDGTPLTIRLLAPRSDDFPQVSESLVGYLRALGVSVDAQLVDADTIQQSVLLPRAYDILIYELSIGVDPDVYAYWHSSQANPSGFNLANYQNAAADDLLVSARFRSEANLRQEKYDAFVKRWLTDVPAIALYRPVLHYVHSENTSVFTDDTVISAESDRFNNVIYWSAGKQRAIVTP